MVRFIAAVMAFIQAIMIYFGSTGVNTQKWKLEKIPAYEGGVVCETVYDTGSGLLVDKDGPTASDGKMQLVSATNLEEYLEYLEVLRVNGFEEVYSNELEGVVCNAFRKDGKLVYSYFSKALGEVRVIEDNCTKNFEDFGYTYSEGSAVTVYQFDYPYCETADLQEKGPLATNGMMYILRLADNSLVVIDGGAIKQSSDKNVEECMKFMRKITGTEDGGKIRIALWYGTHNHSDHITFFYKLIGFYHDFIDLERLMFNYPSYSLIEHTERTDMFRKRIAKFYPNAKYLAPHTGMSLNVANLKIDVLYTHEDAVSPITGKTPIKNANDGSTVCRLTAAGKRFLVLGDLNVLGESKIVNMHGKKVFKTDILQAPHHLYNSDVQIYANSKAEYVLCSMSYERAKLGQLGYSSSKLFYKKSQMLYANDALYGIEMSKDGLTLSVDHTDCGPYDNSSMNTVR
ncbi:MAG: hypothetical protein Q4D20_05905 [Clostridia bacterium]|nr:hypothetical protein [Clostridia bacterium]